MRLGEKLDGPAMGLKATPGIRKWYRRRKNKTERKAAKLNPEHHQPTYGKYRGYET